MPPNGIADEWGAAAHRRQIVKTEIGHTKLRNRSEVRLKTGTEPNGCRDNFLAPGRLEDEVAVCGVARSRIES